MKLLRYGPPGQEKPGLVDREGMIRDLSGELSDLTPEHLSHDRLRQLSQLDPASLPAVAGRQRLGVPVAGIRKFIAVGLNYADHAAEAGLELPREPVLFTKAISCLAAQPMTSCCQKTRTSRTGRLSSVLSSVAWPVTSTGTTRCATLPATVSSTTLASANISSNAAAPGTRAKVAIPSVRSAHGW